MIRFGSWARQAADVVGVITIAVITLAGCAAHKKAKSSDDDDNAKAFSELDKNDKDDPSARTKDKDAAMASSAGEKPKGPVYPAPFTAEQIHAATKNGRTYRYKVEVPTKPTKEYTLTFRNVDDSGAEVHQGEGTKRMGWIGLQQGAEFPKDKTTTHKEKLKTPSGKYECIVYEVESDDGETMTYFFAKKLPGAPVFFYVERDGKRVRTTTLIEYLPGK